MKILLLTQWFDPEPTFKGLLFAKELQRRGHEVEVLTGFPNYPGGRLYPGFKIRPWQREQMEGIPVLRVALYPSHDKSGLRRVLNYASFAVSAAILGTLLVRRPDVIYVYHPPATIGLAAAAIGFFRRAPFVYDIQDLWPDTVAVSGMISSPGAMAVLGMWCQFVYGRARRIVVLSPGFKRQLVSRGVSPDKVDVIYNWCDEAKIQQTAPDPALAATFGLGDKFRVMFAGTMGTAQALDAVLDAAGLCLSRLPGVQFVFVGGGVDLHRLKQRAAGADLANVVFLPRQEMSAMGGVLGLADVLLVHLKKDPLFEITIPSKTQAYLAAGKPILMGVRGDAARLITESGGGVVCEPEDPVSIAAAVTRLASMSTEQRAAMGQAGKRFYDEKLSLNVGVERFEALFESTCGQTVDRDGDSWSSSPAVPLDQGLTSQPLQPPAYPIAKRLIDIAGAAFALLVLSPIILAIAIAVRIRLGTPVIFRQVRPGYKAELFTINKFRTMRDAVDPTGAPLMDSERLHPFGSFLRKTSLDELPEFWNVLCGEMSLVGPRPLLVKYLPFYTAAERVRFAIRPGITGWAQVNGRNEASWNERLSLDIWYVKNQSLLLDFRIMWMTIRKVLRREQVIVDARSIMLNLDEERSAARMVRGDCETI
jgi:lipopolysaccharide/colanic/teichoic acid biosynthesis glycosyltransferase/glycosyltransferase involved in cell wall biosynthesis